MKITENLHEINFKVILTTAANDVNFGLRVLSSVMYAPLFPIWSLEVRKIKSLVKGMGPSQHA